MEIRYLQMSQAHAVDVVHDTPSGAGTVLQDKMELQINGKTSYNFRN